MKFLCPQCERLVELRDFKLDSGALVIACPACHASSRVAAAGPASVATPLVPLVPVTSTGERPALQLTSFPGASNVVALRTPGVEAIQSAAEAARTEPFAIPEGRCPKCISPRTGDAPTCAYCGLTFARFEAVAVEPPQWLKLEWVKLLSEWDDEELHVALRQRALQEQELASLGRLYRLRLSAHAEDPISLRGRDEVLRLALLRGPPPTPAATVSPALKYVLVGAFLLACLTFLVLMARRMLAEPG